MVLTLTFALIVVIKFTSRKRDERQEEFNRVQKITALLLTSFLMADKTSTELSGRFTWPDGAKHRSR